MIGGGERRVVVRRSRTRTRIGAVTPRATLRRERSDSRRRSNDGRHHAHAHARGGFLDVEDPPERINLAEQTSPFSIPRGALVDEGLTFGEE